MAEDSSNRVSWLLELRREHSDWLAGIRHWSHLKVATETESLWVSGFSEAEIMSVNVRSIPAKKVWRQEDNQLFPEGSRLPFRAAPALLWTPIERGLPLSLPGENHNFFGIDAQVPVQLTRTAQVHAAVAMTTSLNALRSFIETAAAVRLRYLRWVIMNGDSVLILGAPLLPIPGDSFWQNGNFLMPAGYNFEWPAITITLRSMMNIGPNDFAVWSAAGGWFHIPGAALKPLTIGSFRQSALLLQAKTSDSSC